MMRLNTCQALHEIAALPKCKGINTCGPDLSRAGPSLVYTLLIGWLYMLPRLAFIPRSWICGECGEHFRKRTRGSYVALIVLILLLLAIVVEAFYGAGGE